MDSVEEMTSLGLERIGGGSDGSVTESTSRREKIISVRGDGEIKGESEEAQERVKERVEKSRKISRSSLTCSPERECERKRHLTEEIGNENLMVENSRLPSRTHLRQVCPPNFCSSVKFHFEDKKENGKTEELQRQNFQLMEALLKIQAAQAAERKKFHEILFGIDKALSSLPVRLEKIRVRNQRNLSIINSSRFHSGDGNENLPEQSDSEFSPSEESLSSESRMSSRMKCLLQKMDQLNDLVRTIQEGDSSPIEFLVNSELYAISLLKKEIKSTKRQIEDNKSDTETITSCEDTHRELTEGSCTKAKNSFSNELNKASNFKIFENHMMLQEKALNLLTRKIKETEEALLKETEAKEGLRRENEAMAKEIFRLKSTGEEAGESKREKSLKTEKLKPESEATGNRPFRLIKELKTKLEEKEKFLLAWKSKYARLEAASSNKTVLLEGEKKKNIEMEATLRNLKIQNKSMSTHINSLQFLNDQLRDQIEILKHQVEVLANEELERELQSASRDFKKNEISTLLEEKAKEIEKEANVKVQKMQKEFEKAMQQMGLELQKQEKKNEEFEETIRELLIIINSFGMEKDIKNIKSPRYDRIREILHITPSDLELFFTAYATSSAEKEVEKFYGEFKSIVNGKESDFSETLSLWLFNIIENKLLHLGSCDEVIRT